ncbi:hypothetical protein FIBSPDRAFT_848478, partial [Athelia psychrophila]
RRHQNRHWPIYTDAQPAPHNSLHAIQHTILIPVPSGSSTLRSGTLQNNTPITASQKRAIIAGVFAFVLLLVLGAVFWDRRRRKRQYKGGSGRGRRDAAAPKRRMGQEGESIRMRSLHSPHPSRTVSHPSAPSTSTPSPRSPGADAVGRDGPALVHRGAAPPIPRARRPPRRHIRQYLARAGSGSWSRSVFREQLDFDHDEEYRDEDEDRERGEGQGNGIHMCTTGITTRRLRSRSWRTRIRRRTQARRRPPCGPAPLEQGEGGESRSRAQNWIERTLA